MNTAMLLIVLSAKDPNALAEFYSRLGLEFRSERSGAGPEHFRCVTKDLVFEIHPYKTNSSATANFQLGFDVESIEATLAEFGSATEIVKPAHDSDRGRLVVLRDPEGHSFELKEVA